jgi:TPR repeat protein
LPLCTVQADVKTQILLAVMYTLGQGVIQDTVETYTWWNVDAAQGDENARKQKDSIAKKMTPIQLEKAQELSKVYYEKYVK